MGDAAHAKVFIIAKVSLGKQVRSCWNADVSFLLLKCFLAPVGLTSARLALRIGSGLNLAGLTAGWRRHLRLPRRSKDAAIKKKRRILLQNKSCVFDRSGLSRLPPSPLLHTPPQPPLLPLSSRPRLSVNIFLASSMAGNKTVTGVSEYHASPAAF